MTIKVVALECGPAFCNTFESVGILERIGEDSNGEPLYSPTEFGIKFMEAHRNDSHQDFVEAIERLRRAH